jgi:predicted aspartyl protease
MVWYIILKYKYKHIKLKCLFLPTDLESVFEDVKNRTGVEISGILGNDFLKRYKYIIDYKHQKIYHGLNSMSLKGWMDLVDVPGVTLCQGTEKFHFLLDTGANNSHISQKALNKLNYEVKALSNSIDVAGGYGGESINYVIKSIFI